MQKAEAYYEHLKNKKNESGKIFCPLTDSWHIETPEEKVRQEYIKILVEDYGYSLDQIFFL